MKCCWGLINNNAMAIKLFGAQNGPSKTAVGHRALPYSRHCQRRKLLLQPLVTEPPWSANQQATIRSWSTPFERCDSHNHNLHDLLSTHKHSLCVNITWNFSTKYTSEARQLNKRITAYWKRLSVYPIWHSVCLPAGCIILIEIAPLAFEWRQ